MKQNIEQIIHDLKSPLTVIQGFLNFLEPDKLSDDEKKFHAAACESLRKMNKILDQLNNHKTNECEDN